MSREQIEKKDQRLIKEIREIINHKEKKTRGEKTVLKPYKFWLPVLCAGLILAGLMIFKEQPETIVSNNSEPIYRSEPTSENTFETGKAPILEKFADHNAVTDTENIE